MSFLEGLKCTRCGAEYTANHAYNVCTKCFRPLFAYYDLKAISKVVSREAFKFRAPTLWRYGEFLPVASESSIISLGEGFTPLIKADRLGRKLGMRKIWIKDESTIPTGTFKARGFAVAVSKARELGIRTIAVPSAGNAAGAAAAYGARAGMDVYLFLPEDAPAVNKLEAYVAGAKVFLVKGLIGDAGRLVADGASKGRWFDMSTFKEPYRVEGKKTLGFEVAEQLCWHLPDVIVYPTGGGTGLVGIWKAFNELEGTGLINGDKPRMIAVQPEGCAPVVKAFREARSETEFWEGASTVAAGLRVPKPFADTLILSVLRDSGGLAIAVSDRMILEGVKEMARAEGIFACPEGGATVAGLKALLEAKLVDRDEQVVLLSTGSGLKYLEAFSPTFQTIDPATGSVPQLRASFSPECYSMESCTGT
jgi:threonine synthase